MQRTGERGANALTREFVVRAEGSAHASAEAVYGVLADLSTHVVWAGEWQRGKSRLLTIEAPPGPAVVGTEFASSGADPMGTFRDRSVVTEAQPGRVFEFVIEAQLTTKKGETSEWTNVVRYELEPTSEGCRIVSTTRLTWINALPGMLKSFNIPGLRSIAQRSGERLSRRTIENLARYAEEQQER